MTHLYQSLCKDIAPLDIRYDVSLIDVGALLGTYLHNSLLPVTLLTGGVIALLCNLICILPGEAGIIPLNAVTPVLGAPVIIYVIVNQRKIQYFN